MSPVSRQEVVFRIPEPKDGRTAWEMAANERQLDTNSPYYYTMWFRDFAKESLLATAGDEVLGFLTGYRRPEEPETYVVWQIAVRPRHGIPNLGVELFERAAAEQLNRGAKYVEATVSADNKPIIWVLKKFAKKHSADIETRVLFPSEYFPEEHHDEVLYRIGPIAS